MKMIEEYVHKTINDLNIEERDLLLFSNRWHNGAMFFSASMSMLSSVLLIYVLFQTPSQHTRTLKESQ
jgi:hypothetical protein